MTLLNTDIWVKSYLCRLQLLDIPAYVVAKGDPDKGAVMVKLNLLNGRAKLFQRSFDLLRDRRCWILADEGEDAAIDGQLSRESGRDSDLWIIEVEDRRGRTLLDEPGIAE